MKDGDLRKILALTGSAVLMLGVFMPIVSLPIVGTMTYFKNGEGDGIIVLALGAISLLLVLANQLRLLAVTGILSLGVLGYTLYELQSRIAEMRAAMERDLAGNPFAGLARGVMEGVQLQWGWALLVAGAGLVIVASVMRSGAGRIKCPHCAELVKVEARVCKHCGRDLPVVDSHSAERIESPLAMRHLGIIGLTVFVLIILGVVFNSLLRRTPQRITTSSSETVAPTSSSSETVAPTPSSPNRTSRPERRTPKPSLPVLLNQLPRPPKSDDSDSDPKTTAAADSQLEPAATKSEPDAPRQKAGVPSTSPGPAGPVRVGGAINRPQKIRDVPAVYPTIAESARIQGVIIIEVTIAEDGTVQDARVLRSIPLLDQAALDAVRQWIFAPTTLNGVPVSAIMTVTVNFTLR